MCVCVCVCVCVLLCCIITVIARLHQIEKEEQSFIVIVLRCVVFVSWRLCGPVCVSLQRCYLCVCVRACVRACVCVCVCVCVEMLDDEEERTEKK